MEHGVAIVGVLGFFLVMALIGAIILRASVSLYNKMTGGNDTPWAVPEPSIGEAMGITLVSSVLVFFANACFGPTIFGLVVFSGEIMGARGVVINAIGQLVANTVGFLVMSGMLSNMLPTTFRRAVVVTLCFYGITLVVLLGTIVVVGGLMMLWSAMFST